MKNFGGGKKPFTPKKPAFGAGPPRPKGGVAKQPRKKQPSLKNQIRGLERLVRLVRTCKLQLSRRRCQL